MIGLALAFAVLGWAGTPAEFPVDGFILPTAEDAAPYRDKGEAVYKALTWATDRLVWGEARSLVDVRTGLVGMIPPAKRIVSVSLVDSAGPGVLAYSAPGGIVVALGTLAGSKLLDRESGRAELAITAAHELTHTFQRMAGPASMSNPHWLIEGLAVYASGDHKWDDFYKGAALPPLSDDDPLGKSYARGVLFFRFLEGRFGAQAVHEFLKELVARGKTYREAGKAATGLEWEELAGAELKWSQDRVNPASRFLP